MKKITTLALLTFFLLTIILPVQAVRAFTTENNEVNFSVNSNSNVTEAQINLEITNWILDEGTNTLYAISSANKKLLFINSKTLEVENTLTLKGSPTDIIKDDGKIYISLSDVKQIVILDMATRKITKTLYTYSDAYRLVKNGDKLYYVEYDQHCDVYEYDLTINKDKLLGVGSAYTPDIAINKEKNLLYIGESGSSGSEMIYYSLIENKVISKTNYDSGYGFPNPQRNILFDGEKVFYADRAFESDNATRVNGTYGARESIIYAVNDLVFTNQNIYNKNTYVKIGESKGNMSIIEATKNTLYIFNNETKIIKRFNNYDKEINSSNVISLISGTEALKIQDDTRGIRLDAEATFLEMRSSLTEWILDEPSNKLYAISENDKALFFIDSKTLNIEKTINLSAKPTDIIKDGDNLYIALDDINQIVVVDLNTMSTTEKIFTSSDPYRIVKNGNKIYYTEYNQHCDIYEYDLISKIDRKLQIGSAYNPDLAINKEKNILYIGESGSSGSNMIYYSITEDKVISITNYEGGYGFSYPERKILFDGSSVFYAGRNFKDDDAKVILGEYNNIVFDTIIYTSNDYAFTKRGIYDKKTYSLIGRFDVDVDLIAFSSEENFYIYDKEEKIILRIEPDITAPVVNGVKNDSVNYNEVTITFNEGTATLNGKEFISGEKVSALGEYVLEVVDDSGNTTVVKFTISEYKKEDVNKDGIVDVLDISMISLDYNKTNKESNWNDNLDINKDGIIDIFDVVIVAGNIK